MNDTLYFLIRGHIPWAHYPWCPACLISLWVSPRAIRSTIRQWRTR